MFGKSKEDQDVGSGVQRSTATPGEATSSISSGLSIVGKIVGHGAVTIFGHVEGELQASTVVIAEGAEVEGDIVAEELTVSGRVERYPPSVTGDGRECAIRGSVATTGRCNKYAIARSNEPSPASDRIERQQRWSQRIAVGALIDVKQIPYRSARTLAAGARLRGIWDF